MGNEIVERVAIAIKNARALPGTNPIARLSDVDRRAARAAIAALREPSEAMLESVKPWPSHWAKDGPYYPARLAAYRIDQMTAASDWQAMIDRLIADASLSTEGNDHAG